MSCRRCTDCGISYPTKQQKCLGCGGKLDTLYDKHADKDWLTASFEAFYTLYDARREGESPDAIGRAEGRQLVAQAREIKELEERL